MENQGTPIGSTHHGMKNTTDPRSKQAIQESAGPVASDSLAAESYNAGGEFSENRNAAPSGQSGASSTLNNTDTFAARKINPTNTRTTDSYDGEGESYPEQVGGQPSFSGNTSYLGYTGGPSAGYKSSTSDSTGGSDNSSSGNKGSSARGTDRDDTGDTSTYDDDSKPSSRTTRSGNSQGDSTSFDTGDDDSKPSSRTTRSGNSYNDSSSSSKGDNSSSHFDKAPNYIADVYLGDTSKPKGANLTEDDNLEGKRVDDGDYEIGSKNDPGRAALKSFENANSRTSTGQASTQREIDGDNVYEQLQDEDN